LERAREVAIDYYNTTGKPLGITGEMGEYLVAKELGLKLAQAREPGFDAVEKLPANTIFISNFRFEDFPNHFILVC